MICLFDTFMYIYIHVYLAVYVYIYIYLIQVHIVETSCDVTLACVKTAESLSFDGIFRSAFWAVYGRYNS